MRRIIAEIVLRTLVVFCQVVILDNLCNSKRERITGKRPEFILGDIRDRAALRRLLALAIDESAGLSGHKPHLLHITHHRIGFTPAAAIHQHQFVQHPNRPLARGYCAAHETNTLQFRLA